MSKIPALPGACGINLKVRAIAGDSVRVQRSLFLPCASCQCRGGLKADGSCFQRGSGAGRRNIKELLSPFGDEILSSRSGGAADQSKEKEVEERCHADNIALRDLLSFIAAYPEPRCPDTLKLSPHILVHLVLGNDNHKKFQIT